MIWRSGNGPAATRPMTGRAVPRQSSHEPAVADFVAVSSHVNDTTLRLRGGAYLRIWRIAGIPFETAATEEIAAYHDTFNQLVRALGARPTALWAHKLRRRMVTAGLAPARNPFCKELDARYGAALQQEGLFKTELYLSLVLRPERRRNNPFMNDPGSLEWAQLEGNEREALASLDELGHAVEAALRPYGVNALRRYQRQAVRFSEALEFLGYLVNGVWEPVPDPVGPAYEALPTSRLVFGADRLEIRGPVATRFCAIVDLKDYPDWSEPGMLNALLYAPYEYIETQSFSTLAPRDGLAYLRRQRNQLIAGDDAARGQIEALDLALEQLLGGRFALGEYHYSLAILADHLDALEGHLAQARATLHERGFQTAVVDLVPDAAWFAQQPGNWRYRPRAAKLSSKNFTALVALHNLPLGNPGGGPWGGPVTILRTSGDTPYYFNFHNVIPEQHLRDVAANTMLIGQTGAGKTVLELFLLAQLARFEPCMVLFDKDRSSELAVRAMGGRYAVLKMGEPTGLSPFALPEDGDALQFQNLFVRQLVAAPGGDLSGPDALALDRALATLAGFPRQLRSLSTLRQLLPSSGDDSLAARLARWCQGGALGWAFDAAPVEGPIEVPLDVPPDPSTDVPLAVPNGPTHLWAYDYTQVLDQPLVRTPLVLLILKLTESRMDGRRFVYVVSECWKALADPVFAQFLQNQQKTIRKRNGFGIFDTQSPADVLTSPIARTLVEQTSNFIFLANPQARREDYVEGFKLTQAEFEAVAALPPGSRSFLLKQGARSCLLRLDLGCLGPYLELLGASARKTAHLDELLGMGLTEPSAWIPRLLERLRVDPASRSIRSGFA